MKKVMLYVGGAKVDLNGQDLILMNWAQNDLTNPTIVKNNYSKQIELEGTPANNAIFGGMIRLDRKTIYSEEYTGISFDPMRRTPFALYDDMLALLESGYIKLNSVKRSGSHFTYSVTLYGGLGAFFYSLSYKEDGTKKTLADLDFGQQRDEQNPTGFGLASALKASDVMDAWDVMGGADPAVKKDERWNFLGQLHLCAGAGVHAYYMARVGACEAVSSAWAAISDCHRFAVHFVGGHSWQGGPSQILLLVLY